jgi:hypothetical protein
MREHPVERKYAIVEAPSILGLRPSGVEKLAERVLAHGFAEHIGARHAVRLSTPLYSTERDPETRTLNAHAGPHEQVVAHPGSSNIEPSSAPSPVRAKPLRP